MTVNHIYETKKCLACGLEMQCKAYDIDKCDCNRITVSKEEQEYIRSMFLDCLCNMCLEKLKVEFHSLSK